MQEFFSELGNLAVIVFTVTSMISVGLAYSWRELLAPLKNLKGVVRALAANFIFVPLLAWVLIRIFDQQVSLAIGLFLVSTAGGAAFLIKLSEVARVNVGLAATILLLLLPATVIYMPLVVPLIVPEVQVSAWEIGAPLLWMLLLPLVAAVGFKQLWPAIGDRIRPLMSKASTVALIVLVVSLVIANVEAIVTIFMTIAIVVTVLIIAGAYLIGYALGGATKDNRYVQGFATGQRNYAAAMVVAGQALGDTTALMIVIVASILGMAILFPIAFYAKGKNKAAAKEAPSERAVRVYEAQQQSPALREV